MTPATEQWCRLLRSCGQLLAEGLAVLGLLLAEPGVLEEDHVAVGHGLYGGGGLGAGDGVDVHELDLGAQLLAQPLGHGGQGLALVGAVLDLAQVGAEDDLGPVAPELLDGRQGGHDAGLVGDLTGLQGDVEVAAEEDPAALDLEVVNSFLCHDYYSFCSRKSGPVRRRTGPLRIIFRSWERLPYSWARYLIVRTIWLV